MSGPSRHTCDLVDARDQWHGIRALRDDEPTPKAASLRYRNAAGYVRVRWHVGVDQYVELYEHRLMAGRPPAEMDVHHINHRKDDNRTSNLLVLTRSAHAALHALLNAEKHALALAERGGYRSQEARAKAERRIAREAEIQTRSLRWRELYEDEWTTTAIAESFGVHVSQVSRHLRRVGTTMRPFDRSSRR